MVYNSQQKQKSDLFFLDTKPVANGSAMRKYSIGVLDRIDHENIENYDIEKRASCGLVTTVNNNSQHFTPVK